MHPFPPAVAMACTFMIGAEPLAAQTLDVVASPLAIQQDADPFVSARDALLSNADKEVLEQNFVRSFARQLPKIDPDAAELERLRPGASLVIAESIRPAMKPYSDRISTLFRARILELLRSELNDDDIQQINVLYGTQAMRKMMRIEAASNHFANTATAVSRGESGESFEAALQADKGAAIDAALEQMTDADLQEIRRLSLKPGFETMMQDLSKKIARLRMDVLRMPMLPSEAQAIEAALAVAVQQHLEAGH